MIKLMTIATACHLWRWNTSWTHYETDCVSISEARAIILNMCNVKVNESAHITNIAPSIYLYQRGGWYVDDRIAPTPLTETIQSFNDTTFGLGTDLSFEDYAEWFYLPPKRIAPWTLYGRKGDIRLLSLACRLAKASKLPRRCNETLASHVFRTSGAIDWSDPLPINVFGCGQLHSKSPPCHHPTCWGCFSLGMASYLRH